eukprot:340439-Chlamydomonas_euryale.AAC.2
MWRDGVGATHLHLEAANLNSIGGLHRMHCLEGATAPRCRPLNSPRCTAIMPTLYRSCAHAVPRLRPRCTASMSTLYRAYVHAVPRLCPVLQVLYLYDNRIRVIEGLVALQRLTHLYLQNNDIEDMSTGLAGLKSLSKLYLQV